MRLCRNCNTQMIESDKIYATSDITGGIAYGPRLVVTKAQTKLRKKLNISASDEPDWQCSLSTTVCPTCGLVEMFLSEEKLANFNEYIKSRKDI